MLNIHPPLANEANEDEEKSSEKTTKDGTKHNHGDEIFLLKITVAVSMVFSGGRGFSSGGAGAGFFIGGAGAGGSGGAGGCLYPRNSDHEGNG